MTDQMTEEPPLNKAIGDIVAHAGGDAEMEAVILGGAMVLCSEYLARAVGRGRARDQVRGLDAFLREARPARPWKD